MSDRFKSLLLILGLALLLPVCAFALKEAGLYRPDRSLLFDAPRRMPPETGDLNLLFISTSLLPEIRDGTAGEETFATLTARELGVATRKKVNLFVRSSPNMSSATVAANLRAWIHETRPAFVLLMLGNGDLFNPIRHSESLPGRFVSFLGETELFKRHFSRLAGLRAGTGAADAVHSRIRELERRWEKRPEAPIPLPLKLELIRLYDDAGRTADALRVLGATDPGEAATPEQLLEIAFFSSELGQAEKFRAAVERLRTVRAPGSGAMNLLEEELSRHGKRTPRAPAPLRFSDPEVFPALAFNYRWIVSTILEAGAVPVPIELPLSVEGDLRALLPGIPGLKPLEIREPFRAAVATRGYDSVFKDHDILHFGHLTPEGHALLAGQISRYLLKEHRDRL